jgi:membrane associated rhomboid family serine protease
MVAGSLAFLIRGGNGGCLGLSGVTLAMMALQAKLSPDKEFRMMVAVFPVKLKADMALTCMLIWSVVGSVARNSQVAHTAHLGGLLFGMAYYEVWLRRNKLKWYVNRAKAALPKFGGGSTKRTR